MTPSALAGRLQTSDLSNNEKTCGPRPPSCPIIGDLRL